MKTDSKKSTNVSSIKKATKMPVSQEKGGAFKRFVEKLCGKKK